MIAYLKNPGQKLLENILNIKVCSIHNYLSLSLVLQIVFPNKTEFSTFFSHYSYSFYFLGGLWPHML